MPDYIELGKIVNTHGLKGELKVTPWCDNVSMFEYVPCVYIDNESYKVISAKVHKHSYLVKLEGIEKIEQAELLKTKIITANINDMPTLSDHEYYIEDIIGITVYENDKPLGEIIECFPTGSNDVYVVKLQSGKDLLIPAIKQTIKSVDIEGKRMNVSLMEGLMPDEN